VALLGDAIYTNPFVRGYAWQRGWLPLRHESLIRAIELNDVSVDKNKAAFEWGRRSAHDLAEVKRIAVTLPSGQAAAGSGGKVIALHTPKALDASIAMRVEYLTAYQNAAYARRYLEKVEKVRVAELALSSEFSSELPLTEAVARNLHKLMAYKDEYEVARLYTDPAFTKKLAASFEGDWKLKFHLAPPMLSKRDSHGHLLKRDFGPWMMPAFRVLAKFKFLRGGPFDFMGKTEERRTERALIREYEALVDELLLGLRAEKMSLAVELAQLPDGIRGFGHVKDNNLRAIRVRWAALLANWRAPKGATGAHIGQVA
jgi:indolepyruvate ferredoxin oxidoreductase